MKKEQVLNAIVGKLISEGVLAENYNTNEALMVLSHCVMPIKLQTYLVNCEEEVKVRLEKLSQIKQINATENPESLPRIKQQFTADEAEDYINQEVERRIAERMPSEEEINKQAEQAAQRDTKDGRIGIIIDSTYYGVFCDALEWLLSCLTCSEKPNNSQKTEGGAK